MHQCMIRSKNCMQRWTCSVLGCPCNRSCHYTCMHPPLLCPCPWHHACNWEGRRTWVQAQRLAPLDVPPSQENPHAGLRRHARLSDMHVKAQAWMVLQQRCCVDVQALDIGCDTVEARQAVQRAGDVAPHGCVNGRAVHCGVPGHRSGIWGSAAQMAE